MRGDTWARCGTIAVLSALCLQLVALSADPRGRAMAQSGQSGPGATASPMPRPPSTDRPAPATPARTDSAIDPTGLGPPDPKLAGAPIPDRYIVVLRDDAPLGRGLNVDRSAADVAQRHAVTRGRTFTHALKGFAAQIPSARLAVLRADSQVLYVAEDRTIQVLHHQPLPRVDAVAAAPSEQAPEQDAPFGIRRIGASGNNVNQTLARKGAGVGVAVLDTGIQVNHPDLAPVQAGTTCVPGTADANDENGHGTHVAGTIAGRDNAIGVVGVAPLADFHPVKVVPAGGAGSLSDLICGIDWVTANSGPVGTPGKVQVAAISVGGTGTSTPSNPDCSNANNDPLHSAICRAVQAGVTVVAAAGNGAVDAKNSAPAAYEEVITVSALSDFNGQPGGGGIYTCTAGRDDSLAPFANFGPAVDVAAPGVCVYSTWLNGGYRLRNGASSAAAHAAGAAALAKGATPGASPAQVQAQLIAAQQPGPIPLDPDGAGEGILWVGTAPAPPAEPPIPAPPPSGVCSRRDSFGYGCADEMRAWVPGTADIGNHCDDCTTPVTLPFPFTFYGQAFTQATVSSNGNVQFASNEAAYVNTPLPDSSFNQTIFVFWDDLRTDAVTSGIFSTTTGTAPNRIFVLEWRSTYFSNGASLNFAVHLEEATGEIHFLYNSSADRGSSATAGIQRGGNATFLQISHNESLLTDGRAVRFTLGRRTALDFDGDALADAGIWNPSTGRWFVLGSAGGILADDFGHSTDIPVAADYDGDGRTDLAMFTPSIGHWYGRLTGGSILSVRLGSAPQIPTPADYDGDGRADVAAYDPRNGRFYILRSTGGLRVAQIGPAGYVPVPADYDGDGRADLGVRSPMGHWFVELSGGTADYTLRLGDFELGGIGLGTFGAIILYQIFRRANGGVDAEGSADAAPIDYRGESSARPSSPSALRSGDRRCSKRRR